MDPLIIFKGKHMQSTWFGDKALPGTFYGKSENGTCFALILFKTKSNQLYITGSEFGNKNSFAKNSNRRE